MSQRMMRKAQTLPGFVPTDPLSTQIERSLRDERNLRALEMIRQQDNKGGPAFDAVVMPIVQKVAEQVKAQLDQGSQPKQEDTNQMLNDYLKQRLTMKQLDALDREGQTGNAPKDLMAFAEGAVNIQKGAAETALSLAEMERQRRIETEEEMGGAIQHARQEEQQKANQTIEMIREMNAMVVQMTRDMAEQRLSFAEQLHQNALQSIQKQAEEAIQRLSSTFQDTMTTKDQVHQKDLELIKKDHELALLKHQTTMPLSQDPDYIWKMDQIHRDRMRWEQDHTHKDQQHQAWLETQKALREDILPDALKTVRSVFGGGISMDNPLAGGPPPDPDPDASSPGSGPGLGGLP